ncbi:MAG: MarR family winged helix-turn-helix transcriptional regulator [Marvinbryantia sp.]|uniref:MarR family winged helix-turn-helix transcriptional regulator n=1 Tax=Marvinbryantia sp. TaxID=2496532 RepID=UPI0025D09B10|nr:MarR family winged helix-turn-helix transcriptional regulator [uncultured Marvinbryantia sp.]
MDKKRTLLMEEIWESQNEAWALMNEYDSLPHQYGDFVLHQAEAEMIDLIALHPDITVTDLSHILRKTPSACSQIVKKLRTKKWVDQTRDENNNRQYKLKLTDEGYLLFKEHTKFENNCKANTFDKLSIFNADELQTFLKIQHKLNEAYAEDVENSKQ